MPVQGTIKTVPWHYALCFGAPPTLVAADDTGASIEGRAAASIGKDHAVGATIIPTANNNASPVVFDRIDASETFLAGGIHEVAPAAATAVATVTIPAWAIPVLILPAVPSWRLPVSVIVAVILRHSDRRHQLRCGQAGQRDERNSCKTSKHPSLLTLISMA
ncbi:hypothetical protein A6U85_16220 [Agrobacterium sp. 13-626]|nr:hypothetical protein CN09_20660 [Rhizobium rhizogenes]OCI96268.1 hypothetical protein A6U85_16220 [Agrobacterium sp. 13-626]OCJ22915.1 hypothetical protein A6U89_09920 [Agrobacterium sp. B133/95]